MITEAEFGENDKKFDTKGKIAHSMTMVKNINPITGNIIDTITVNGNKT